ncbi:MAG TPA: NPCBM/NEW2 domain-containing protein [Candidatus Anammoximicrobium sp.]|nr:NPCBM/NEW2 domain-containing protein [Candidatus Anammoximicrobium sp.]
MGNSSPVQEGDSPGRRISGVAVVVALLLLVAGGAGLSVAMYFLIRPVPAARPNAVAQADRPPPTLSDDARTGPAVTVPTPHRADDHRTNGQPATEMPASGPKMPPSSAGLAPDAGGAQQDTSAPPEETGRGGFDVLALSPIEIEAAVASKDAWRRPVKIGGQSYDRAVCLRPAEDQGTTQIAFELGARFVHLQGVAGIADLPSPSRNGADRYQPQAVFRVYGDGNLLWESKPLSGRGDHQTLECPVAGVDVLTFVAESRSPAAISDLAWADLKLFASLKNRSHPGSAR